MIKLQQYIFWFLLLTALVFFFPDKDELLIGSLILLVILLLLELVGFGLIKNIDDVRKETKVNFYKNKKIKEKILIENLNIIDESSLMYKEGSKLLEIFYTNDFNKEVKADFQERSRAMIEKNLSNKTDSFILEAEKRDFEIQKDLTLKFIEEVEKLLKIKN